VTPDELSEELVAGRVRPAYLLMGPEALLRDRALEEIREAALAGAPADFNLDRLEGERATPGELQDAVRSLPVLAERRLVVLREPEARRGGGRALTDALAGVLESLAEQGPAVLVVTAARADRRARWVKAFRGEAAAVACEAPRGAKALAAFVRAEAKRSGLRLERGAAELLVEAVGSDLLMLRHELEKAALFAGERPVTADDVRATASVVAEEPVWDLTDAIGEGRGGDALRVLRRMRSQGAPPPVLLGALATHFRKLARTRAGEPPPGHPFAVRKLESQARRYTPGRLVACLRAIHEVDEVLKGAGAMPEELALERLVIGLAG
jgi:DNA polymerase-3 subunit delta